MHFRSQGNEPSTSKHVKEQSESGHISNRRECSLKLTLSPLALSHNFKAICPNLPYGFLSLHFIKLQG